MKGIFNFPENKNYSLRSGTHIFSRDMKTTKVSNLGTKIWLLFPEKLKNTSSLHVFKNKLNECKPTILNTVSTKNLIFELTPPKKL